MKTFTKALAATGGNRSLCHGDGFACAQPGGSPFRIIR